MDVVGKRIYNLLLYQLRQYASKENGVVANHDEDEETAGNGVIAL